MSGSGEYIKPEKDRYIKLSQALEVLDGCACWWAHEAMERIPAADDIEELSKDRDKWKATAQEERDAYRHWFDQYQKDVPHWIPVTETRLPFCKLKEGCQPIEPEDCENCVNYHNVYKRTRGDRIRSMIDEKLAEFEHSICACPPGSTKTCIDNLYAHGKGPYQKDEQCCKCWLDWLKQEATND